MKIDIFDLEKVDKAAYLCSIDDDILNATIIKINGSLYNIREKLYIVEDKRWEIFVTLVDGQ